MLKGNWGNSISIEKNARESLEYLFIHKAAAIPHKLQKQVHFAARKKEV